MATKVDRPKKKNLEPQFLGADELEVMFKALRGIPFELPVLVAVILRVATRRGLRAQI